MYLDAFSIRRRNSLFTSSSAEVASSTLSFSARNCSTISECSFSNSYINKASSKVPSPFASQTSDDRAVSFNSVMKLTLPLHLVVSYNNL